METLQYILAGHTPVPEPNLRKWAGWMQTADRRVARTEINIPGHSVFVSTVFLGMNHEWGEGAPLLFETMIFGGPEHGKMDRYATWEEAEAGHARMVAWVRGEASAE